MGWKRAKDSHRYIHPNITGMQAWLIKQLEKNETYKVISVDNNCGLVIIETEHLTKRMLTDHLGDVTTCRRLTTKEAFAQLCGFSRLIEYFISKWKDELSVAEYTYLKRRLKWDWNWMARFYTMIKMHKDPYIFRTIIATCGTALSIPSSWLDYKLKQPVLFLKKSVLRAAVNWKESWKS